MAIKKYVGDARLRQVLQAVNQKIADSVSTVFKTDPAWEAASLAILESWIVNDEATDPINNRTVENYDVYLSLEDSTQYYFDSGVWLAFSPNMDLSNYYTKSEADAEFTTQELSALEVNAALDATGFPEIN